MSTYCDTDDIDQIFGTTNVTRWADLDCDANATKIANRKTQAIVVACEEIDDYLRNTPYRIPAQTAAAATPASIAELAATLAGIWLYEARGAQDFQEGKPYHRYAFKRTWARRVLAEIADGTRKIDAI